MKISQVIKFLEETKKVEGDLNLEGVTGFWIRHPDNGEKVIEVSVGNGASIRDITKPLE